jgi:hypothetical protein
MIAWFAVEQYRGSTVVVSHGRQLGFVALPRGLRNQFCAADEDEHHHTGEDCDRKDDDDREDERKTVHLQGPPSRRFLSAETLYPRFGLAGM